MAINWCCVTAAWGSHGQIHPIGPKHEVPRDPLHGDAGKGSNALARSSMHFLRMGDIQAAFPRVDDLDALDQAKGNRALGAALELCRPRNWWGTGASQSLLRAARSEGLPLAWVPRSEIIVELDGCADDQARLHVLESRRGLILQDCEDTLGECTDEWVIDGVTLARRALEAIRAGHDEAGMALAVALGEPLAAWAATPRAMAFLSEEDRADWEKKRSKSKYPWAQIEIDRVGNGNVEPWDFTYQVLIAPIPRFFTPWWPDKGTPPPKGLSRQVVAHQPTLAHFSTTNALLAVMLVTSILRQQQDWSDEVGHDDAQQDGNF